LFFSKTLKKTEWKNTKLIKEITAEMILKMKRQPGKNIVIYGSGSIASTFMNLGLIDDYLLFVNPVVSGSGKPLFKNIKNRHNLLLANTKTFKSGVFLLDYQPVIAE
jgi:dihydrofolate reductase